MAKQLYDLEALAFACPHCGAHIQVSHFTFPEYCSSCRESLMGHGREKHRVMTIVSEFLDQSQPTQKQPKQLITRGKRL